MTYFEQGPRRHAGIIGLALLLFASASGCAAVPRVASPEMPDQSIRVGETVRWYKVYRPASLPARAPAIVLLHGGTGSMYTIFGKRRAKGTRAWLNIADRHGALLIVPNGLNASGDARGDRQNWNDGREWAASTGADDVGFIEQLVAHLAVEHDLDSSRIFATGASNGGMMTYRLLVEAPAVFAGGAAFIANMPRDLAQNGERPPPVPIMIATSTDDRLMPYRGGEILNGLVRSRGAVLSTRETVAWWAKVNNARPPEAERALPDTVPEDGCRLVVTDYPAQGNDSAPVTVIRMDGGGHAMPTRLARTMTDSRVPVGRLIGTVCNDAEGAELAWDFFSRASR
jgi:polyhydroxybutyrate depolymerase